VRKIVYIEYNRISVETYTDLSLPASVGLDANELAFSLSQCWFEYSFFVSVYSYMGEKVRSILFVVVVAVVVIATVLLLLLLPLMLLLLCHSHYSYSHVFCWLFDFKLERKEIDFSEKSCMWIEYDRTPIKIDTYLSCICLHWMSIK